MTQRIVDFPDGYTSGTTPTFGDGLGDGSLEPFQETPTGTINGSNAVFTLTYPPYTEGSLLVFVDGVQQTKDTQWNLSGSTITFNAGSIPQVGQSVTCFYVKASTGGGGTGDIKVEYRTLSGAEITAAAVTLTSTAVRETEAKLDVIEGGPQFFGADFSVTGNQLSWSGLALDGVLTAGDKIRITYFI